MELKNSIALVTGGNSGLGKATAIHLIQNGATVIITGRNQEKTEAVAQEIGAIAFHCDVRYDDQIEEMYSFIKKKFGKLDILINNAGIGKRKELGNISRDHMLEVFEVNVIGATMVAQGALPFFKQQQSGNIVNIASTAALKGYPTGSIYVASKFALRGLTQCWQGELRRDNIRVIQINPSEVPTAFGDEENRNERALEDNKLSPEEIAHTILSTLKMDNRGYIPEVTVHATNPF